MKGSYWLILLAFYTYSCGSNREPIYLKKVVKGKIVSEGYYRNDSIKVGTHKNYFPNGNVSSISTYNNMGQLEGLSLLFYDNGRLWQKRFFKRNLLEGNFIEYYSNGKIKTRGFHFQGKIVGDVFFYKNTGALSNYNFIDFSGNNLIYAEFEESGHRSKTQGLDQFFEDSLITSKEHILPNDTLRILSLISHVPYTKTNVRVLELYGKDNIGKQHTISDFETFNIFSLVSHDSLKTLRVVAELYDSVFKRNKTIISDYKINP